MVSTGTQYQVQFNSVNGLGNLTPTKLQAPIPKDNEAEDSWPPNNQDKLKQAKSTYNSTVQTEGGSLVSTGTQHETPWPVRNPENTVRARSVEMTSVGIQWTSLSTSMSDTLNQEVSTESIGKKLRVKDNEAEDSWPLSTRGKPSKWFVPNEKDRPDFQPSQCEMTKMGLTEMTSFGTQCNRPTMTSGQAPGNDTLRKTNS